MNRSKKRYKYIILIDLLSIVIAFLLAGVVRFGYSNLSWMISYIYREFFMILLFGYTLAFFWGVNLEDFFHRGYWRELSCVLQSTIITLCISLVYMFLIQRTGNYSRIFVAVFLYLQTIIMYCGRQYIKVFFFEYYRESRTALRVVLISTTGMIKPLLNQLYQEDMLPFQVEGIALLDQSQIGERYRSFSVIADQHNFFEVIQKMPVDEVLISLSRQEPIKLPLDEIIYELESMGITAHLNMNTYQMKAKERRIENFGGCSVLTFETKVFHPIQKVLKRIIDIIGGFVGVLFTGLITLFIAPAVKLESPGPVFFSQVRVGKNGRRFRMYKFRSMYADAEQRKQELLKQNEMDGLMFKMTNDPRITKVGAFLRKTSLDEFPQFWNVLKGDMSLVGTRPPTEDEFNQYQRRHVRRLMIKPGITGMWQANGRSDISDFEEVVKMDLEYIDNWSLLLDLKLLCKTALSVFLQSGSK